MEIDILNLRIRGLRLSSQIQRALLAIIVKWVERTFEFLDFTITCQSTNKQGGIIHPWQHCFKDFLIVLISFTQSTFIGFYFNLNGPIAQSNSSLYWLFYARKSIEVTFAALATKKETWVLAKASSRSNPWPLRYCNVLSTQLLRSIKQTGSFTSEYEISYLWTADEIFLKHTKDHRSHLGHFITWETE